MTARDERWADSEPALVELIREEILAAPAQRITFARYMDLALTAPELGYYATSDRRPTREGDFLTAPELHPFFGRCIGRQLDEIWRRLGRPDPFTVREYGAGRGTLRETVAAGLRADGSELADSLDWVAIDLPDRSDPAPERPFEGVVLANEYLDALPVHRLQQVGDTIMERWVTWHDGWFAEVVAGPSSPGLARTLAEAGTSLAGGQVADVSPGWESFPAIAARRLARGVVLVIDYGHPAAELYGPRRLAGTLMGYHGHRAVEDPFARVGRMDLTAHVDLNAVERGARAAGLAPLGSTSQAEFLVGLGLGEMLRTLGEQTPADPAAYLEARAAVARFLDPRHLGGFRVLGFGRGMGAEPPLRGFLTPLRH
ncbi:MAG: SAM-dependent methyltransferase [Chloroflexi bacterium]|nr:SAM-dependent methyltransferase [Chloroflexota bacterium]